MMIDCIHAGIISLLPTYYVHLTSNIVMARLTQFLLTSANALHLQRRFASRCNVSTIKSTILQWRTWSCAAYATRAHYKHHFQCTLMLGVVDPPCDIPVCQASKDMQIRAGSMLADTFQTRSAGHIAAYWHAWHAYLKALHDLNVLPNHIEPACMTATH